MNSDNESDNAETAGAEFCPICKTDKYLSPDMKFLVNPECYHKMCESCVDRIFSLGPAPCPYPGCGIILRKNRFKSQVFEDVNVEREVDIRKRVCQIYNKREEDFDSLDEYNAYLEEIERIIFNLTHKIDVEATEKQLREYELENKKVILRNSLRMKQEDAQFEQQKAFELEMRKQNKLLAQQEAQEESMIKQEAKKELVNRLMTSDLDADSIAKTVHSTALKKTSARRKQLELKKQQFYINRLGRKAQTEATVPFTPFNGDRPGPYAFTLEDNYYDPFMDELAKDKEYIASGFKVEEEYRHALVEAFFGLGCIVEKEKAETPPVEQPNMQSTTVS